MNIYFDVGGVLFKDGMTSFTVKLAEAIPLHPFDSIAVYKELFHKGIEARKLRKGDLSLEDFFSIQARSLESDFNIKFDSFISQKDFYTMWFDEYQPIKGTFEFIDRLSSSGQHTFGVISANFKDRFDYIFTKYKLYPLFEKSQIYLTHQLRCDKKNPLFYKKIIDQIDINLSECLYIDDNQSYVNIAKSLGFQHAYHFDYRLGEDLESLIDQIPFLKHLL